MTEDPINMTIYAPAALRNRIKSYAATRGQSMSSFVAQTLTEALDIADAQRKEVIHNIHNIQATEAMEQQI